MSELEGLFNIWVFLAIAAGACVMILINIIEAYILKLKHRRRRNELTINSDIDPINLQGLRTRRGNYISKNREHKNKNKNANGSKSN
jgi:phosphate/sulfate permease